MGPSADKQQQQQPSRRVPVGSRSGPISISISSPTSPLIAPHPRAALNASGTGGPSISAPHIIGPPDDPTNHGVFACNGPAFADKSNTPRDRSNSANATCSSSSSPHEQIASLQRELAAKELDKMAQLECETSSFWQAKHSALHQQFLRTDAELRVLRSGIGAREHEAAADQAKCEALRREVVAREDEACALRAQVRGLKEWVSTSTRAEGQTSDEVFAENVARLADGLQNWVIVNFRRARIDLSKASLEIREELSRLIPCYEVLASTSKLQLLQSIVSSILVDAVFNAYFIGLTEEQTREFRQMEDLIFSLTMSPESINHWRAATLTILRREAPMAKMQPETDRTIDSITMRINNILDAITVSSTSSVMLVAASLPPPTLSETPPNASACSTVATVAGPTLTQPASVLSRDAQVMRALVAGATDLARQLASQRAIFSTHMPLRGAVFDASTMEDFGGVDDDALASRKVHCVVFPGIIKTGDEQGTHLHFKNVVAKARVLLCPYEG